MKKLLACMMVLILSLSLAACGSKEITLESKTINDITLDVPSDFGEFTETQQVLLAANEDSTATITVSPHLDAQGVTADLWDEQAYAENILASLSDVQILEFSNTKTIAGVPAVFAHYTAKNQNNASAEAYSYLLYFEDGTYQSIAFNFNSDKDTSLKQNIDAIISSIK